MGVYACNVCNWVVDGNLPRVIEPHGEELPDRRCPICRIGELIEATRCKVCNEWFADTEEDGICDWCLEENADMDTAIELGDYNQDNVAVNSLVTHLLSAEEINQILLDHIKSHDEEYGARASWYCRKEMHYEYLELLEERVKNNDKTNIL